MKKTVITFSILSILTLAVAVQSCTTKDSTTTPGTTTPTEFVADNNTFKGFEAWHLHATKNGVDPSGLGGAHGGTDSSSVRKIYFTASTVNRTNGEFPIGTIIAKKTSGDSTSSNMITAMAKRGNNFDAAGNNWEYLVLAADGSIMMDNGTAMRGANLMNGMCKGCHAKVAANDYVFTK